MKKQKQETQHTENKAISTFEKFFYRFVAWFPILTLPLVVVEMFSDGQMAAALLIALMHAVLVFRFVQVMNVGSWFRKKSPA